MGTLKLRDQANAAWVALRGPRGLKGAKGDKGDTGDVGPTGPPGTPGTIVNMVNGSYTGTGSGSLTVNLGFTPKLVIINPRATNLGRGWIVSTRTDSVAGLGATNVWYQNGYITTDGFVVSGTTQYGLNFGTTYDYVAIG